MAQQYNLGRVVGKSAYEVALDNGYTGTEQEWLASLNGTNGTNGTDGVSPAVTVARNQEDTGAVITVTDANGTTTATVNDGSTPSLTGYATETYVDNAIADIDIPANTSDLNNDSGFITSADLSGYAQTSSLATVATSGSYADLTNKPTIPDVSGLATETYVDNAVAGIAVPTATSDLTNDSGFVTANDLAAVATSGDYDDLTNKPTIPTAPGIATTTDAGLVKPDGTTITIDANGTISSAGGSSTSVVDSKENVIVPITNTTYQNSTGTSVGNMYNAVLGYKNRLASMGYAMGNIVGGDSNILGESAASNIVGGSYNTLAMNLSTNLSPMASIVGGYQNRLIGSRYGVVVGTGLKAMGWNQAIFGKYNSDLNAPLVIGMGTADDARADAFKVTSAGNGVFAGTVQATDFLDSNGDSIIGSGGDSLPTINSGDAGKALVVNSREDGVEWATVSGGSVPVDPEASLKNVLTGEGTFANAWGVVQDASYGDLLWEEPVEQDTTNHRFIFVTSDTFDYWGEDFSPLSVTMLGEDSNGNLIDGHDGFYWNGNDGYQNRDGFLSITRVIKSSGNNIYYLNLLLTGEGTYEDIATINQFEISFDDFQRIVKENIPSTTVDSSSRYIWTNQDSDNMFSIGLNMYPTPESNFGADIDIPDLSVTPTSVTVDGVTGALYEFELTAGSEDAEWFDDWISAERQKEIKLYDTQGNETGIMFEETDTTSPLTSMEDALVERNRNGFTIFMPGYDVRELLPIQEIKIGQYYTSNYGLVDYDYIQNEVISRPPEFPISYSDNTDPTTARVTEWQPNRIYFIENNKAEQSGEYVTTDIITSYIGTQGVYVENDNKADSTKDIVNLYETGIEFTHREYTDDGQGNVTNDVEETLSWTPDGIQLRDTATGDIYNLSIRDGQLTITQANA